MAALSRKQIFDKANKEFTRLSGFDLMHGDEYIAGTRDMNSLIAVNYQWLLDHANDVERGLLSHMKKEIDAEGETMEEHIRRVSSDLLPTPERKW